MGMVDIALLGNITLDDMLHHLQTDERTDPNARLTLKSSEKKSACISTLAFRCGGGGSSSNVCSPLASARRVDGRLDHLSF